MNRDAIYYSGERDELECDCGARLEVRYSKLAGHNEKETFECPNCHKEHSLTAALPIKAGDVKVL